MNVVVTGIGLATPLGLNPAEVLTRVLAGDSAAREHELKDTGLACPVCARIKDFQPQQYLSEPKMLRLMNRDAQLAAAAARLCLQDARLASGRDYQPEEIGLFGATGLAGLPLSDVLPLLKASIGGDGQIDLERFGRAGLRSISPLLSFKILSNMPLCFVSIFENIQGPNAVYTPWEGQGAQAIESGMQAIISGQAKCALVGGCDVKTHELALISLERQGIFDSWRECKCGTIPGEGAAFLFLEQERAAAERGAQIIARIEEVSLANHLKSRTRLETYKTVLAPFQGRQFEAVVAAADGDPSSEYGETVALLKLGITVHRTVHPKQSAGNLFAGAAALQLGLGALLTRESEGAVLVNCFGHGAVQASFVLRPAEVSR